MSKGRGGGRERNRSPTEQEPDLGAQSQDSEPKAEAQPTEPPRCPTCPFKASTLEDVAGWESSA